MFGFGSVAAGKLKNGSAKTDWLCSWISFRVFCVWHPQTAMAAASMTMAVGCAKFIVRTSWMLRWMDPTIRND
ncbi:hypothetical protein RMSM_01991 [Rhodopirellula maiorica SM1]|uniref:Uncharacterized protein n=1 Tax=Rhodopirellula maiorica SM1 TaxID=1265738 RepID=M5S4F8_9BACT|nr:hypothetical protein RMSM_01991 [Rhodopirellula maiorica SM1]